MCIFCAVSYYLIGTLAGGRFQVGSLAPAMISSGKTPTLPSQWMTMLWILLMFYFLPCKLQCGPGGDCQARKLGAK